MRINVGSGLTYGAHLTTIFIHGVFLTHTVLRRQRTLQWRHNKRDGRLKSPALRLFTEQFIQGADKKKNQSSASLAFVRGVNRWIPCTKGQ